MRASCESSPNFTTTIKNIPEPNQQPHQPHPHIVRSLSKELIEKQGNSLDMCLLSNVDFLSSCIRRTRPPPPKKNHTHMRTTHTHTHTHTQINLEFIHSVIQLAN